MVNIRFLCDDEDIYVFENSGYKGILDISLYKKLFDDIGNTVIFDTDPKLYLYLLCGDEIDTNVIPDEIIYYHENIKNICVKSKNGNIENSVFDAILYGLVVVVGSFIGKSIEIKMRNRGMLPREIYSEKEIEDVIMRKKITGDEINNPNNILYDSKSINEKIEIFKKSYNILLDLFDDTPLHDLRSQLDKNEKGIITDILINKEIDNEKFVKLFNKLIISNKLPVLWGDFDKIYIKNMKISGEPSFGFKFEDIPNILLPISRVEFLKHDVISDINDEYMGLGVVINIIDDLNLFPTLIVPQELIMNEKQLIDYINNEKLIVSSSKHEMEYPPVYILEDNIRFIDFNGECLDDKIRGNYDSDYVFLDSENFISELIDNRGEYKKFLYNSVSPSLKIDNIHKLYTKFPYVVVDVYLDNYIKDLDTVPHTFDKSIKYPNIQYILPENILYKVNFNKYVNVIRPNLEHPTIKEMNIYTLNDYELIIDNYTNDDKFKYILANYIWKYGFVIADHFMLVPQSIIHHTVDYGYLKKYIDSNGRYGRDKLMELSVDDDWALDISEPEILNMYKGSEYLSTVPYDKDDKILIERIPQSERLPDKISIGVYNWDDYFGGIIPDKSYNLNEMNFILCLNNLTGETLLAPLNDLSWTTGNVLRPYTFGRDEFSNLKDKFGVSSVLFPENWFIFVNKDKIGGLVSHITYKDISLSEYEKMLNVFNNLKGDKYIMIGNLSLTDNSNLSSFNVYPTHYLTDIDNDSLMWKKLINITNNGVINLNLLKPVKNSLFDNIELSLKITGKFENLLIIRLDEIGDITFNDDHMNEKWLSLLTFENTNANAGHTFIICRFYSDYISGKGVNSITELIDRCKL